MAAALCHRTSDPRDHLVGFPQLGVNGPHADTAAVIDANDDDVALGAEDTLNRSSFGWNPGPPRSHAGTDSTSSRGRSSAS